MKTTYQLGPARLKIAIEHYMASIGKPVTDADEFTVAIDGTVTVVITEPDDAPVAPVAPVSTQIFLVPTNGGTVQKVEVALPVPGHMVQVDPPLSVTGQATEFGFHDPQDNGQGFFYDPATGKPYATNNDTIRGVSLPREVLLSTFLKIDSWKTEGIDSVWSRNEDLLRQWVDGNKPLVTIDSGGKSASGLPIVDAGPTAGTDNAIDLTGKITEELGTHGKALATFMIVVNGVPIPIRGWDFAKGRVG